MMCFDLGGPVNKAAYLFATAGLASQTSGSLVIMATVMAAGMVPPLAMALSTAIRPKLYTPAERDNGKAAWLLGASFISEGAIPFAAADPIRVIPSMMLGGATTGAIVASVGIEARAPHGGVFVFFAISNFLLWLLAIVIGTVVGGLAVTVAKSFGHTDAEDAPEDAVDLEHAHAPVARRLRARSDHLTGKLTPTRPQQRGRGSMPSQTVTVGSRVGLHARPAALIAEAVGKAGVPVTLATPGGNPIDAGSPLMIMTLGAKQGTEVIVTSDDQAALDQIAGMVAQDLDAE